MKLQRNLIAGMANSVWSALVSLGVVPFYLKYLGIEAYGLVGFLATTQSLFQLLDLGLTPAINREVARCLAVGAKQDAANILHTLAILYWILAGIILSVILALAPWISENWLNSKQLPAEVITQVMVLMGLLIACRWPIGIYQGVLIGAQRLTVSSSINIIMLTIGNVGAVAVLAWVSPTIQSFFLWQTGVAVAHAMTMRFAAWRILERSKEIHFSLDDLKRIARFSIGMSGVAITAVVLMQLDKILLSRILSLEDFGRYTLAGVVAGGLYILLTPVFNVIYPRLSSLAMNGNVSEQIDFYRTGTSLLLAILFPIAITGAVFASDLVSLWTGSAEIASSIAPVIGLFLLGTSLNGAMHFPYALQLAYGMSRLPLLINTILIVISVPTITILSLQFGMVGGAAAWALLNGIYVLIGTWLTHRTLLKGIGLAWLFRDVGMPLAISSVVIGLAGTQFVALGFPHIVNLFVGAFITLVAIVLNTISSPRLTQVLLIGLARRMR